MKDESFDELMDRVLTEYETRYGVMARYRLKAALDRIAAEYRITALHAMQLRRLRELNGGKPDSGTEADVAIVYDMDAPQDMDGAVSDNNPGVKE